MKTTVIFEFEFPDELSPILMSAFHQDALVHGVIRYTEDIAARYKSTLSIDAFRVLTSEQFTHLTAELEVRP